ncbi:MULTISPECIES: SLC13 family permease [unclassified Paenibacillus]|uniref:SLC13 family permease n=1 Tax=unclassified Paenibacillus TaxID=185978 RepID=UPI0024052F0E|nr:MULTISPECIES: SLC13 family permease [unclassified Paenibacillus]MDF9845378.1 di/tricarboxylate transporter [Paenibacillus sp. PastF-2]MDF9851962.1 di/tricarboxylate transporter [Paenibacillus sp. PastM-2]MDF9858553.1 di/tricarboxylate transporter [Paenibacillus sp. PastF-1]MDH6483819.1 di/tricarboxylate transporter [Paenibacillus sp. PastH-2]MDH6511200.1 di/tricarboxylate transporter [Paenibacillus sp. PastM-3]
MTMEMILALGILILMIVMIMSDKFAFGAPPIIACLLLVVTGLSTVPQAFAGFINPSVIMIAGFMVVMAGLMKTDFIGKVQSAMVALVNKGGYKSYVLLVVVVMLGASLAGSGSTGYYVLILSIVSAIPYNKKMPTSKLMMPLGFATNHPLVPFNVALFYGVTVSVLETAGYAGGLSMAKFAVVNLVLSLGFLAWALIAYRLLPDHPVSGVSGDDQEVMEASTSSMPAWKENCTIAAFILSVIGMMLMSQIGNAAYVIPGLAGAFLLIINVLDFKEVRNNMGAPVILMMAGVIGVADALANSGFTAMIGEAVAAGLGSSISPFILILMFALLTSTCATFTGSNMGSVFIFAPIAITTSLSLGLNPVAAAAAVAISGWNGGYMPIDGMPAMILGMGKYKLSQFWLFSVPMYLIRILAICIGAMLMFPVNG